ncbi:MAG: hypothetical protein FJ265_19915 [Planctomycetes bacterium]|nr:hypothetical protein [Planctomycetota bacterium]
MRVTNGPFAAGLLRASSRALASAAVAHIRQQHPELLARGLPPSFAQPVDDVEVRLLHLAAAVAFDRPALLSHALRWYRVALHHRGVPDDYLGQSLAACEHVLGAELPAGAAELVQRCLRAAVADLGRAPFDAPAELDPAAPHGQLAGRFLLCVLEGRGEHAVDLVRQALAEGLSIAELHDAVLVPVQREAGRMWLRAEIPIADEHYGSAIVDRVLWLLHEGLPRPAATAPVALTMAVGGNLHDLGVRMVAQRLQLAGFAVHHLGANMPAGDLEWAFTDRAVDLVALSASMALHLPALVATIQEVRRITGGKVPVLAGGPPFAVVPDLGAVVGADGAASDAAGAVAEAQRLTQG